MIGDGVVVDLGDRTFLSTNAAGKIAEMIDGKWHIGRHRLAERLAIVERFGHG